MENPVRNSAESAIESALKLYQSSRSSLHRNVKKALQETADNHKRLAKAFENRARKRCDRADKLNAESISAAERALEQQRIDTAQARNLYREQDVIKLFDNALLFSEGRLQLAIDSAQVLAAEVKMENNIEDSLRSWGDKFVTLAVEALSSDIEVDRAIALLSGGLIVAGVATGPAGAITAAFISALLLVREMSSKLPADKRTVREDGDALRIDTALLLIGTANGLFMQWLQILEFSVVE